MIFVARCTRIKHVFSLILSVFQERLILWWSLLNWWFLIGLFASFAEHRGNSRVELRQIRRTSGCCARSNGCGEAAKHFQDQSRASLFHHEHQHGRSSTQSFSLQFFRFTRAYFYCSVLQIPKVFSDLNETESDFDEACEMRDFLVPSAREQTVKNLERSQQVHMHFEAAEYQSMF